MCRGITCRAPTLVQKYHGRYFGGLPSGCGADNNADPKPAVAMRNEEAAQTQGGASDTTAVGCYFEDAGVI